MLTVCVECYIAGITQTTTDTVGTQSTVFVYMLAWCSTTKQEPKAGIETQVITVASISTKTAKPVTGQTHHIFYACSPYIWFLGHAVIYIQRRNRKQREKTELYISQGYTTIARQFN